VRPRRDFTRRPILRVQPPRYYRNGGFELRGGRVVVNRFFSRTPQEVAVESVRAVVCACTLIRSEDWRVLLVGDRNLVLARRWGPYYDDDDLTRLATAMKVPYRLEYFDAPAQLANTYHGAFRFRWERHPGIAGFVLGGVVIGAAFAIAAIAHAI
jgi:hypothetical protein